ncbi:MULTISPECIES: hypothetical protein [Streptomyces]|uniref:Uncharacterized protein n=1 Tax=Streptomyces venezuelae TaxID=54571 RepID=A0A5P2AQZ3_STRVZ|nr:hypothetical protein [Streptomyces venezuelae]QES20684.1 hypothetical protein DEJ46_17450 [Streptomyces venezuelae]
MALEVPDLYRALIAQYLAWPEADEGAYRSVAVSLNEYIRLTGDDTWAAHKHIERLLSSGSGEAMDALGQHWSKVKDQHATSIEAAATGSATTMAAIADRVEAAKLTVVSIAAELAVATGAGTASGPLTFGASQAVVAAAVTESRTRAQMAVDDCLQDTYQQLVRLQKDPSVAALEGIAADLAAGVGGAAGGVAGGVGGGAGAGRGWGAPSGTGRAIAGGVHVDHAEHRLAAGKLREVATAVLGTTAGALSQAAGHHATAAASGSLGAALAPQGNAVLDGLSKVNSAFGDHLNGSLPDAVLLISTSQRATDDDNKQRMSQLDH